MLTDKWQTSSRSGNNGQCVEARYDGTSVEVRNSKKPQAGTAVFTAAEWNAFIPVAADEFKIQ